MHVSCEGRNPCYIIQFEALGVRAESKHTGINVASMIPGFVECGIVMFQCAWCVSFVARLTFLVCRIGRHWASLGATGQGSSS